MFAFIDVQGFIVNKKFIFKELSFQIKNLHFCWLIKSPIFFPISMHDRTHAFYLTSIYHGLHYTSGNISLTKCIKKINRLCQPFKNILVLFSKGHEKCKIIEKYIKIKCLNIEHCLQKRIQLKKNPGNFKICKFHQIKKNNTIETYQCSSRNVKTINFLYNSNKQYIHDIFTRFSCIYGKC